MLSAERELKMRKAVYFAMFGSMDDEGAATNRGACMAEFKEFWLSLTDEEKEDYYQMMCQIHGV